MQFLSFGHKRNQGRNASDPSQLLDGTQSKTFTFIKLKRFSESLFRPIYMYMFMCVYVYAAKF